ncbi:Nuclear control of ATPase protein 2 [Lobosporangium transversale]|uniref:ATP synthase regulation protein NCA2-domain-containing protein n=1 Tax=Lobosporangium transversale TaxID=64571 RepID=A0A1Y2GKB1_9FUNG|nr:ATP synthase regulation protein NCA2-domain-containing protein [Lobosporangium transversale]KAF9915867.1 Nuclear control of ATPase protein 2 [Lobosporangium transversale]ORZ09992.1 ATP synthase regulation protein NCA2-domain-containing protein [Lobosporangium transversale]|eukprot:XP_021879082.1 ATP synthase regulation protein NCA2-domain-containing protein [Lobosporangium transversale]
MGTFITDRLHQLNSDLIQLFHLDHQPPLHFRDRQNESGQRADSPANRAVSPQKSIAMGKDKDKGDKRGSDSAAESSIITTTEQTDHELLSGLRASIDALDLHSNAVPSMERVYHEIEKVEKLAKSTTTTTSIDPCNNREISKLEHLFIAKCTISVYLNLLDIILNATLPLANEIQYWQSLIDSRSWRLLYTVQTSPYRVFDFTRSVLVATREHLDSLITTAPHNGQSDQDNQKNQILQIFRHFPTFLKYHLISQPVSFPVAIRYEITNHRRQLQRIREYQAECLGLLSEQGLNLDLEFFEDSVSVLSSPGSGSASGSESGTDSRSAAVAGAGQSAKQQLQDEGRGGESTEQAEIFIRDQTSKTICLMERVLNKAYKDMKLLTDSHHHQPQHQSSHHHSHSHPHHQQLKLPSAKRATRSLTILGQLQGIPSLSHNDTLQHLKQLIQIDIPQFVQQTETQARQFYRPSWLTRIWIPALVGYFGLKFGLQYVTEHRADLDRWLEEAWDTAKRFVTDWVWEPTMRIMAIIRHTDEQGSLQMLGNESLKSDIASLERMVLDFGKQNYHLGGQELASLSQAVHNGDISMIMRAYEQELKTPFKGAIVGNLVQTLLIQVQKTKVDVEVAMAALDKLLKANELNFAFLAVGPSLLLLWAVSAQSKKVWQRMAGRHMGVLSIQMKNSMRQVERLLNLASAEGEGLDIKQPRKPQRNFDSSNAAAERRPSEKGAIKRSSSSSSEEFEDLSVLGNNNVGGSADDSTQSITSDKLTRIRTKEGKVPYKTQGLILCEVHLLRTFAARLTRSEGLRDKVMEDLREIEESSLTVHQRLRTAQRMYRTYGFLGLHQQ